MADSESPDYREVMRGREERVKSDAARNGKWLALVVVLVVGGCSVLVSQNDNGASSGGADDRGAFDICKRFVRDRLKSPSTATFRNFLEQDGEVSVVGFGDGPYTVVSTVDSQNGFGAQVRSTFTCTVNYVGDGQWHLDDVAIR